MSWERLKSGLRVAVSIPAGVSGVIYVPVFGADYRIVESGLDRSEVKVWDKGRAQTKVDGISSSTPDGDYVKFEVGSGFYRFETAPSTEI